MWYRKHQSLESLASYTNTTHQGCLLTAMTACAWYIGKTKPQVFVSLEEHLCWITITIRQQLWSSSDSNPIQRVLIDHEAEGRQVITNANPSSLQSRSAYSRIIFSFQWNIVWRLIASVPTKFDEVIFCKKLVWNWLTSLLGTNQCPLNEVSNTFGQWDSHVEW